MGKLNKIQEFDQTSIFCFFAPEFFAKNKKFIKGKKLKIFVFVAHHTEQPIRSLQKFKKFAKRQKYDLTSFLKIPLGKDFKKTYKIGKE